MSKKTKYHNGFKGPGGVWQPLPEEDPLPVRCLMWVSDTLLGFLTIVVLPAMVVLLILFATKGGS